MLFDCEFTWNSGTTRTQVAQRFVARYQSGDVDKNRIMGWYNWRAGARDS